MKRAGPENQSTWVIRGRTITPADLQTVQDLLIQKPGMGRWALALELCRLWRWRRAYGDWKARAALAVLVRLEQWGWIQLPTSKRSRTPSRVRGPKANGWGGERIEGPLSVYRPLRWELVQSAPERRRWRRLLDEHHPLGSPGMVGANLKYFVYGQRGHLLGALGWQSAVGHLGCRDRALGWTAAQRAVYLDRLVNNVRFLVMPWVQVPNLASALLSEGVRQLQVDWPRHYAVPVWWAESFVDGQCFEASSYRAAHWQGLGWTEGFAKRPEGFVHHGHRKEVYVYVMEPRMRRWIHQDDRQPLMSRAFLLAQRVKEQTKNLTLPRDNAHETTIKRLGTQTPAPF